MERHRAVIKAARRAKRSGAGHRLPPAADPLQAAALLARVHLRRLRGPHRDLHPAPGQAAGPARAHAGRRGGLQPAAGPGRRVGRAGPRGRPAPGHHLRHGGGGRALPPRVRGPAGQDGRPAAGPPRARVGGAGHPHAPAPGRGHHPRAGPPPLRRPPAALPPAGPAADRGPRGARGGPAAAFARRPGPRRRRRRGRRGPRRPGGHSPHRLVRPGLVRCPAPRSRPTPPTVRRMGEGVFDNDTDTGRDAGLDAELEALLGPGRDAG